MLDEPTFQKGDSLTDLLRKVLLYFNQPSITPPMSAATQFAPGDTSFTISRKILTRLNEIAPLTGDVNYKQGDSLWSIWKKILDALNQLPP